MFSGFNNVFLEFQPVGPCSAQQTWQLLSLSPRPEDATGAVSWIYEESYLGGNLSLPLYFFLSAVRPAYEEKRKTRWLNLLRVVTAPFNQELIQPDYSPP